MAQVRQYVGYATLGYMVASFPTCSFFLLRYNHTSAGVAIPHSFAYWLISALLLLEAWHLINVPEGPFRIYRKRPHVRKLGALALFPLSIATSLLLFHWMIEGSVPNGAVFWFLFICLLVVATCTGLVCTREHLKFSDDLLSQARDIQKYALRSLIGITALVLGSGLASELVQSYLSEITKDLNLILASAVLVVCLGVSFLLQPWWIVRDIQDHIRPVDESSNESQR